MCGSGDGRGPLGMLGAGMARERRRRNRGVVSAERRCASVNRDAVGGEGSHLNPLEGSVIRS